ncbi:MAG: type II secretion system F family protein [Candidatus Aenigmarchaeota archaeon]|nr:type II secretion system F family protein [Candidatus Aenigmarchaeota archaeon]
MYRLMPRRYKGKIQELITFSGGKRTPAHFFHSSLIISLSVGLVMGIILRNYFAYIFPLVFFATFLFSHGLLYLAVERRTKYVENILPDALQLVAANIKSGFIPSRALVLSARKEFGPLSEGIKNVGKEMMTGKSLQESMGEMTKTIKSEVLETTVTLVTKGVRAGGQLVSLFEETAIDIRRKEVIKKEVRANIMMYAIFIGFAGCVGAPILYALSGFLVSTISRLGTMISIPEEVVSKMPLHMKFGVGISPEFLFLFSITAILITAIFGGLIIGLISSGKEKDGIKYIPILTIASLAIFFVTGFIIKMMFGGLVPG